MQATGTFEVKLTSRSIENNFDEDRFAHMSINKKLIGDIDGSSQGEMLSLHGHAKGSAGYVAIEQIIGSIHGRKGSFGLQHSCFMSKESEQQNLTVIPDSGTQELQGLTGTMTLDVAEDGTHKYELTYELPAS